MNQAAECEFRPEYGRFAEPSEEFHRRSSFSIRILYLEKIVARSSARSVRLLA